MRRRKIFIAIVSLLALLVLAGAAMVILTQQRLSAIKSAQSGVGSPGQRRTPRYAARETVVDAFEFPELVNIDGYAGETMEPCITEDGKYLFFNNSNSEKVETHIHFAKRVASNRFKYLGLLPGTMSGAKDMAPSVGKGSFFFTSTRSYDRDRKSLYAGKFENEQVTGVTAAPGEISPAGLGEINMDCCISADGDTLVIARARFEIGAVVPFASDLVLARLQNGKFAIAPDSDVILKHINTSALEYAPHLSQNGLELYFTRATELLAHGQAKGADLRIMVATRRSREEPFGEPKVISSIRGFVEAPSLTADGSELYFHTRDEKGICRIASARRKH